MKLYGGSLWVVGRESPYALYSKDLVSFEEKEMDQREITGMVKYYGLQAALYQSIKRRLQ